MNNNEQKPKVLLFAEDEYVDGVEFGYYPEVNKQSDLCNLKVEYMKNRSEYKLDSDPIGDGSDLYFLNIYSGIYRKSTDSDLLNNKFIDDQSHAVKESLIKLGAKHIVMIEEQNSSNKNDTRFSTEGKNKGVGGGLDASRSWNKTIDIKSRIEYHNDGNQARDSKDVETFIREHGLGGDTTLSFLLDRLKETGDLSGTTEKYEVSYLSDVINAFDIALKVNAVVFNAKLNLENRKQNTTAIKKVLEVTF